MSKKTFNKLSPNSKSGSYENLVHTVRKTRFGKWVTDLLSLPSMLYKSRREIASFRDYCEKIGYKNTLQDAIGCFFKYGCGIQQYYKHEFFEKNEKERAAWITFRLVNCFLRKANPSQYNYLVNDKVQVCKRMAEFIKRDFFPLSISEELEQAVEWVLIKSEVIVKPRYGGEGKGVEIISSNMGTERLHQYLEKRLSQDSLIIEELIAQHPKMSELYPRSVNTLRIQTVLHNDEVHILGAVLRIGNGSRIDNMTTGGLAAAVDLGSGIVMSEGYGIDIRKKLKYSEHPITGITIPGFEIPFWQETLEMVKQMARRLHVLKSLGWDIAISPKGPVLVEYNRIWQVGTFQIPYKRGRLEELATFMDKSCLYPVHKKYLSSSK